MFKNVYDRQLKQNVANRQSASEFMNNPGVGEEWEAIKTALLDEAG